MIRGGKTKFNNFVKSVKQDPRRYYYIKSNLMKMRDADIDVNTQIYGGQTLLHVAIKLNNLKLFKLFLNAGVNPDLANEIGEAPIHQCVRKNKVKFIKELLNYGADINISADLEQTPLHLAVITGNLDLVKYLVSENAEVLIQDENYCYPIDYAIDEGDIKMIKYFLTIQEVSDENKAKIDQIYRKEGG